MTSFFQLHWKSIWKYKHMHLKEVEILRKMIHYLIYDKTEYLSVCLLQIRGTNFVSVTRFVVCGMFI